MPAVAYAIPDDARDLLVCLRLAHEQNRGLGNALSGEDQLAPARAWLERVLTDLRAREAHTDWLCSAFRASFRPPLPRRLCGSAGPPQPAVDASFSYHALLPEPRVAAILRNGVQDLPAEEVGRLLLNPYALWEIADRIDLDLPDRWLLRLDEVGENLSRDLGIEIPVPGRTV